MSNIWEHFINICTFNDHIELLNLSWYIQELSTRNNTGPKPKSKNKSDNKIALNSKLYRSNSHSQAI